MNKKHIMMKEVNFIIFILELFYHDRGLFDQLLFHFLCYELPEMKWNRSWLKKAELPEIVDAFVK